MSLIRIVGRPAPAFLVLATLSIAPLASGEAALAQEKPAPAAESRLRLPAATVVTASQRTMTATAPINGSLVARERVLVTAQVTGYRITDVSVEVGDQVKAGDVLVRLDRAPLEAQLAQAEAAVSAAEAAAQQANSQIAGQQATLSQAETALSRANKLLRSGAGTQATVDTAETNLANAQAALQAGRDALANANAQIEQARARRDDAALQLSRTEVRSPVDGVIATRAADIGQMAGGTADPLFTLIRNGEVEFDGDIIETAIPDVKPGQKARLYPSGFAEYQGTVRLLSPYVDPQTRQGTVKISIAGNDRLPIGIFARAVVITAERNAVAVPLSAVVPGPKSQTVQVVDKEGTIHVKPVRTGIVEGDFIEIAEGLSAGETVVAKSGPFFRDGMKIQPVPVKPASSEATPGPQEVSANTPQSAGAEASADAGTAQ
ncbi:efflux RND transporter periplasmic adaptor subunit [Mangrovicella endophytica]|uniref:efflux RND transporter periplasmic adaptor subunit n=1 Tax=Mangrovicella endophytica TaxID=2066697 RepID=UPI0012FFFA94|nr:efflux RND transporter periplasmic adaptor subunit [Mangrovicella endophytica]